MGRPVETDATDGNPQERISTAGLKKTSRRTLSFFTVPHRPDGGQIKPLTFTHSVTLLGEATTGILIVVEGEK
jgi:hypothetical protein